MSHENLLEMQNLLEASGNPALFTDAQIEKLKIGYGKIDKVDPNSPKFEALRTYIENTPTPLLKQLVAKKVKWLAIIANTELRKREKESVNEVSLKTIHSYQQKSKANLAHNRDKRQYHNDMHGDHDYKDRTNEAVTNTTAQRLFKIKQQKKKELEQKTKPLKEDAKALMKFNIDYANKIFNTPELKSVNRFSHLLYDVDKETLIAIKKEFEKDPKKKAFFDKATKGRSPNDFNESVNLTEASQVDFSYLSKGHLKLLQDLYKTKDLQSSVLSVWEGIHGIIVDIKMSHLNPEARLDKDDLKVLVNNKLFRWIEPSEDKISIGLDFDRSDKDHNDFIDFKNLIADLKELTDANHHLEALHQLTLYFKFTDLEKLVVKLIKIRDVKMGLDMEDIKKENILRKNILALIKQKYPTIHDAIYKVL